MKKRITAISLMLVLILILTACGGSNTTSEQEPFHMPFGLNIGDSSETVQNAMSEVGTIQGSLGIVDGAVNSMDVFLADNGTYSYLGYDWNPMCSLIEDKLFSILMSTNVPHDDYEVIASVLEKEYGEPNINKENKKEWHLETESITCEFYSEGSDTQEEYVSLQFYDKE